MQFNTTAHPARKIPTKNQSVSEVLIRLDFWHTALQNIRAERRQIIGNERLSEKWRMHALSKNADDTAAIRARLSECQFDHCRAVESASRRIAGSVAGLLEHSTSPPANEPQHDTYEGGTGGAS